MSSSHPLTSAVVASWPAVDFDRFLPLCYTFGLPAKR